MFYQYSMHVCFQIRVDALLMSYGCNIHTAAILIEVVVTIHVTFRAVQLLYSTTFLFLQPFCTHGRKITLISCCGKCS